jgi:hypothetical protein
VAHQAPRRAGLSRPAPATATWTTTFRFKDLPFQGFAVLRLCPFLRGFVPFQGLAV